MDEDDEDDPDYDDDESSEEYFEEEDMEDEPRTEEMESHSDMDETPPDPGRALPSIGHITNKRSWGNRVASAEQSAMEVDDIPQEEEDDLAHAQNQLALQQAIALSQLDAAQAQARASSSGREGTPPLFPTPQH
jgi:hypothetical protein